MNPVRHRARRLAVSALYDGAFTLKIDTTKPGSASDTFVLPCYTGYNFDAVVTWGDGTKSQLTGAPGDVTHVYPAPGVYIVRCWERRPLGFPRIYFFNGGDKSKVLEVMQWGQNEWAPFCPSMFFGCDNMVVTATDGPSAKTSKVTDITTMFRGCSKLRPFLPFPTPNVTLMAGFMQQCALMTENRFTQTGKVTNYSNAFYDAGLKSFPFIDTGLVQNWSLCLFSVDGLIGYDFPTLDMHSITNGTNFLYGVAISKASYNSMLDQLAFGRGSIPPAAASGVVFRCDAHYDAVTGGYDGVAARAYLTGTKGWTITDGGTP